MPQVALGRATWRRGSDRPGGAGAVRGPSTPADGRVGPVPPPDVAGPGHPAGRGPSGGVPGVGEPRPNLSLSLSLPPSLPSPSPSRPVPAPRSRLPVAPRAPPRSGNGQSDRYPWRGGGAEPTTSPQYSLRQSIAHPSAAGAAVRPGPACWRCGDPGHFQDQCPMMEVGLLVRVPDSPGAAPDQAGQYQIPVSIKGGTYQALVDSGCNQTSIHQSLIQQRALDTGRKVKVRCVHGDVADYPLVPVAIKFRGKIHRMEVAVNSHLKHPLILGTDWPAFTQLLGIVCADASWPTGRGQEEAAARTGEALAGPAPPASGETRASEGVRTPELDDFPLEQSRDETLKNAYNRVRSIDGQLLRPDVPLSYPYFSLIKERLYRVTQEAQSKEITTQLLVPKSRREMLFQAAHCTPMAGHLGEAKTRERLMARFFWPGLHENVRRWCAACRECQLVNPPATAKAPLSITIDGGPLRENWYGPHRAIGAFGTRIPLCIGPGGLCNAISGSSAPALHFGEERSRGTVSTHLPSGNPERDSHGSGHGVYVPHAKGTVRAIGH